VPAEVLGTPAVGYCNHCAPSAVDRTDMMENAATTHMTAGTTPRRVFAGISTSCVPA
jgi:hypothetical protein